jgi:hypothetical protein
VVGVLGFIGEAKRDEEEVVLAMAMEAIPSSSPSLASSPEGYSSCVTNALLGMTLFLSGFLGG